MKAAVMIGVACAPTLTLVTVNVLDELPAETVVVEGTVAAPVMLLVRVTVAPPAGATSLKVTVAVEFAEPPWTVVGFKVSEDTVSGFTVRVAVCDTPL